MKQYTFLRLTFILSGNKREGIENLKNKVKKSWFMLLRFLCKSEGKTGQHILNLIGTTIKPVVLYACESYEDPKDHNNLSNIEKFCLSLCKQILGVKKNTTNSKLLLKLGRFPFRHWNEIVQIFTENTFRERKILLTQSF